MLAPMLRAAGGAQWTPAQLFTSGEYGAWYDPADLSTLWQDTAGTVPVTANGQLVARMDDKSGNGLHMIQATSADRPSYQDGRLVFDGVSDLFTTAITAAAFPAWMVHAVDVTGDSGGGGFTVSNSLTVQNFWVSRGDNTLGDAGIVIGGPSTSKLDNIARSADDLIVSAQLLTGNQSVRLDLGTRSAGVNEAAPSSATNLSIGALIRTSTAFYAGAYGGLVYIRRDLTTSEEGDLINWLADNYGVVL